MELNVVQTLVLLVASILVILHLLLVNSLRLSPEEWLNMNQAERDAYIREQYKDMEHVPR